MSSIAQAKRQVTIDALAGATQTIMLERGLDFTMEDVASQANVSRSTVFRHFASREDLIVAATQIGRRDYDARIPTYHGGDWRPWLRDLCCVIHEQNFAASRLLTLATGAEALSERLQAVGRDLDLYRRARYPVVAENLWRAEHHDGPVPALLVTVVAAHLSPFFTAAVCHEADADHHLAAEMAETAIANAVESQRDT